MTRRFTLLLLTLIVPPTVRAADPQEIIDEHVRGGVVAGMAVGTIGQDQRGQYFAGTLQAGGSNKMGQNTVFEIGSVSKVFTTLLLAQLENQGALKLTDPASKYLPEAAQMPTRSGAAITLEQLATHTSGLPRMPGNFSPKDPANPYADYTEELMYTFLSGQGDLKPSAQSKYSNLGMGLLGHLLASRRNTTYEALMIEHICKPLGMNDTVTKARSSQQGRVARGHVGLQVVPGWDIPTLAGAGDIDSTLQDMMTFVAANLGLKKTGLYSTMRRCHLPRVDSSVPELKVGLGWHVWKKHGSDIVWHNGGTGGFASFIGFRPDTKQGVVVLSNSAYRGVDQIGLHLLNDKFELPTLRKQTEIDPQALEEYAGSYQLPMGQLVTVKVQDQKLMVRLSGQDFYQVYPSQPDKFFYKVVDAQISFERDTQRKIAVLVLHQNGIDQKARRMDSAHDPQQIALATSVLERYVGAYTMAGGVTMAVTKKGDQLFAQLSGQPPVEVYPKSETRFFYRIIVAEISFQLDKNGQVESLTLHQGGMDQVAVRKN